MAYQTGTVADLQALITVIETFCTSNGWTKVTGTSEDTLTRGTMYAQLRYATNTQNHIQLWTGDSLDGSNDLVNPRDAATLWTTWANISLPNPFTYHLFMSANQNNFFCIINYNTSYIRHMGWGTLDKYGTYTGGEYYTAANGGSVNAGTSDFLEFDFRSDVESGWGICPFIVNRLIRTCYIRCDVNGVDTWLQNYKNWNGGGDTENRLVTAHSVTAYLSRGALNQWTSDVTLVPYIVAALRDANDLSIIGQVPQLRSTRCDNFNIADIITLGSDQWMIFPWYFKSFTDPNGNNKVVNVPHSGLHAFAIRYEP